jgi:hypothetical protein
MSAMCTHDCIELNELPEKIARSAEPRENWSWCYADEVSFVVDSV